MKTDKKSARSAVSCSTLKAEDNKLNFDILKQNILDKVTTALKKKPQIPMFNPHKITPDVKQQAT